jgi:two-component system cell cycle response regulator DivK
MPSRRPLVVLIAEDFADAREMYEDYLTFSGLTVLTANDGVEAVRVATEQRPDIIVMDAGLPHLTGWEATAMLKGNPATSDLKILMLTGHVFQESERNARVAGVDRFVAKPCLPDALLTHIMSLAGRQAPSGERTTRRRVSGARGIRTRPRPG